MCVSKLLKSINKVEAYQFYKTNNKHNFAYPVKNIPQRVLVSQENDVGIAFILMFLRNNINKCVLGRHNNDKNRCLNISK